MPCSASRPAIPLPPRLPRRLAVRGEPRHRDGQEQSQGAQGEAVDAEEEGGNPCAELAGTEVGEAAAQAPVPQARPPLTLHCLGLRPK